jgi:intein/homing endonuclease
MELSSLKYPHKSHRKSIFIPQDSPELAEFLGIVLGDGGIGNLWQLVISMNANSDLAYSYYIEILIKQLFDLEVKRGVRPRNTLVLRISSTTLVEFLVARGAVRGNKIIQEIDLPNWINGDSELEKAFVRGLVDTDGCPYIHTHSVSNREYRNIGFCFTSYSYKLIQSFVKILQKNGIKPSVTRAGTHVYLYSRSAVERYLEVFGSSNPRIVYKYTEYITEGCWRGRSGRPGKSV